ncbi:MAG: DUF3782 domain-containing protein [Deltaproteobacteria bacterium]|nr:DUF3782 domain-containing protein [Deltaproteobacteria bacterium]
MAGRRAKEQGVQVGERRVAYRRTAPPRAEELLAALQGDPELRARLAALLEFPPGLAQALDRLTAELREQRLATERGFEATRAEMSARFEELRADMNARFEAVDRRFEELRADVNARFEAVDRRFEELRADANARFEATDKRLGELLRQLVHQGRRIEVAFKRIDAMGTRWGLRSEEAFREGLGDVLGERFGVTAERWVHEDREGVVFGHAARVELDVVVRDGETVLVEIKSHVGRADVAEFRRTADLYDKLHGTRSKRLLISPSVGGRAVELAAKLGIEISTALEE